MIPSLPELYVQCRIDDSGGLEDALLTDYVAAAREKAERYLNRRLYDNPPPPEDLSGLKINALIKLAIMQLVNFWYDNRDQTAKVPEEFYLMIRDYRFSPGT